MFHLPFSHYPPFLFLSSIALSSFVKTAYKKVRIVNIAVKANNRFYYHSFFFHFSAVVCQTAGDFRFTFAGSPVFYFLPKPSSRKERQ